MEKDTKNPAVSIGILSIQGAFFEHQAALFKAFKKLYTDQVERTNDCPPPTLKVIEVRKPDDIIGLDGMVIPGGESTVMGKCLQSNGFSEQIRNWMSADDKHVVWGTCAGLILLSEHLERIGEKIGGQVTIGGLDVTVSRNFFGRQKQSFESEISLTSTELNNNPRDTSEPLACHGVFIRAPAVIKCNSDNVEVLGTVTHPEMGDEKIIVAVKQKNIIATAFHPELTDDLRWHLYFIRQVLTRKYEGQL